MVSLVAASIAISGLAQNTDTTKEKIGIDSGTGVLLLAHGGKENWNKEVMKVAASVNQTIPVEVAFGMASKRSIQQAVDKLVSRGARKIVAVPLFISSHSSVISSTEYLLGLRKQAPPELAIFAKMAHGAGAHNSHRESGESFDPESPVKSAVPIRMLHALDAHPLVADILLSRASSLSRQPENEVVVVVAHGPVADEENAKWLANMRILVELMRIKSSFTRIEYLTVRDDAPEPLRARAAAVLREVVKRGIDDNKNVLIVPLLLSYGGIEEGIKKRLEGLRYAISDQALLPDDRIARWVLLSVTKLKDRK